ncbi:MAG: uracil-DNA glycosylase family protein [Planctomycetota bacterium]
MPRVDQAIAAAKQLRTAVDRLSFAEPVTHVYNPLRYAWAPHEAYLRRMTPGGVRVLLLGMNPGPWGMAQTGVPFGEVAAVRDWLGIEEVVRRPKDEHPKRPIEGFDCQRSEVSGRRLWGLFAERFGPTPDGADAFFAEHFVANYCPLVFMTETGRNHTPDKLPADERAPLDAVCDAHLAELLRIAQPEWAVGVGKYAEKCLARVVEAEGVDATLQGIKITTVLHPSPASPAANRGWAEAATRQLEAAGVW